MQFFSPCPRGAQNVLAHELRVLGATQVEPSLGGAAFQGDLEIGYRACLWSRVASRVLMPLATVQAETAEALYEGACTVNWLSHLDADRTFAVHAVGRNPALRHSRFVALKVKDAIVDQIRAQRGTRPNVDTDHPDVRFHVHVGQSDARISLDLSGPGLHRRGLDRKHTEAPLKENLAAAMLLLAQWPERAAAGEPLVDPMCGSGTLLIEAAWIAADTAPGLRRTEFGFLGWPGHQDALWQRLRSEAKARIIPVTTSIFRGRDGSRRAVQAARDNIRGAGLSQTIQIDQGRLRDARPPTGPDGSSTQSAGLLITNPPYGERLGQAGALAGLYETLGDVLRHHFGGWTAAVLTGSKPLGKSIGLRPSARHPLYNGPIECELLCYPIRAGAVESSSPGWRKPSAEAEMFTNRLRKNLRRMKKWARKANVDCYRLYDADIPEYNVAIDIYGPAVHIQEYEPPRSVKPHIADRRLHDIRMVIPEVLGIKPEEVFMKVRRRSEGGTQYGRFAELEEIRIVQERELCFEVNLSDYLDTGVFLDHRKLRQRIEEEAKGRRFLNLFAYTCTATVAAAKGGATSSWSVDLSRSYLGWGRRNLNLNQVDVGVHKTWHGDWSAFLRKHRNLQFDLAYLGPPTYSTSKDAPTFDLQKDHPALIRDVLTKMSPDGVVYFGAPTRRFVFHPERIRGAKIENISKELLPADFERSRDDFHLWRITPDRAPVRG